MSYTNGLDKPSDYFDTITYTGTGSNNQQYYNLSSQADLIWCKQRSTANNHFIFDTVRGTTKALFSNLTNAEGTYNSTYVNALDSTSITWGSSTNINESGQTYVNWLWQGGGTAVSNTQGSITSSVSANTTAGFSIVSYTGTGASATVGHGLSQAPAIVIVKRRSNIGEWIVYSSVLGSGNGLKLNTTGASFVADATVWNSTNPTSSVFSIGSAVDLNASGNTYISYCFAEKKGFSKFGSYTGNGSATDGTFVYTGFKPAFIMLKVTSVANRWVILDNQRPTYNPPTTEINPNDSVAEFGTTANMDLLSNGFKLRRIGDVFNTSGYTYIYMAFAENPFTTSTGIPATAR